MFNFELEPAFGRLDDAVQFRQKGGGYWYPDTPTDRDAIRLTKVTFRPAKTEDEVLTQFSGVCFCQFNAPPLGSVKEAADLTERCRAALTEENLPERREVLASLLDDLIGYPAAATLDLAARTLAPAENLLEPV